ARGDDLGFLDQAAVRASGHAIECRIYAENPDRNFLPSPGPLKRFRLPPADAELRIDTGVREGDQITFHYDPMIAKVIAHGDDRYVLIEFGNEMNLELNFMAQGLASAIEQNRTKGVIETAPCFASMLVHYDPDAIGYGDLRKEMTALIAALGPSEDIELDSRLFYFPTVYRDPCTKACVDDYCAKIVKKEPDPEFVARINGLADAEQ